jgi:hypothetical protein
MLQATARIESTVTDESQLAGQSYLLQAAASSKDILTDDGTQRGRQCDLA